MKRKCIYCGKILQIRKGKKKLNPKRKFCDITCNTRYRYYKMRDDKNYLKKKRRYAKKYYNQKGIKRKQHKYMLDYAKQNKKKYNERNYVRNHREEILKLLPKNCFLCGEKGIKVIHHTHYDFEKKPRGWKKEQDYLKEYSKSLIGFCSMKCHRKYERKPLPQHLNS